jgi:hypothetical protein
MYASISLLLLAYLTLVICRFTAKHNAPSAPTLFLNVLLSLSLINLVVVGISFALHTTRGNMNVLNIVNIVIHVLLLVTMIISYFILRSKISTISADLLILSVVLFIASIPMTLLYLFSSPSKTSIHSSLIPDRQQQSLPLQIEKKLDIEQVPVSNYDAMDLLKQMQTRASDTLIN